MSSFVHADIFFFISSIGVIFFTIFFIIIAVYLVKIMRNLHDISTILKREAEKLEEGFDEFYDRCADLPILGYFFRKKKTGKKVK